jgi:hypothetical protein
MMSQVKYTPRLHAKQVRRTSEVRCIWSGATPVVIARRFLVSFCDKRYNLSVPSQLEGGSS